MTQRMTFMLAMAAAAAGTLCYLAGQPRLDLIAPGTAMFGLIACTLVSGLFWALFGINAGRGRP